MLKCNISYNTCDIINSAQYFAEKWQYKRLCPLVDLSIRPYFRRLVRDNRDDECEAAQLRSCPPVHDWHCGILANIGHDSALWKKCRKICVKESNKWRGVTLSLRAGGQEHPIPITPDQHTYPKKHLKRSFSTYRLMRYGPTDRPTDGRTKPVIELHICKYKWDIYLRQWTDSICHCLTVDWRSGMLNPGCDDW